MSKKVETEQLAGELGACGEIFAAGAKEECPRFVIARLVQDVPKDDWQKFRATHPMGQWLTFTLPGNMAAEDLGILESWLVENPSMLGKSVLISRLASELLRCARSGGTMCLMIAALGEEQGGESNHERANEPCLEEALRNSITSIMETCDSISRLDDASLAVILPGMGQLKSRKFAENVQKNFKDRLRALSCGESPVCAIGLVNTASGEGCSPEELLKRAKKALSEAFGESGHIYQECPTGDSSSATLVHSHEKHFLFFGGDSK